jgi:hypothetical protein
MGKVEHMSTTGTKRMPPRVHLVHFTEQGANQGEMEWRQRLRGGSRKRRPKKRQVLIGILVCLFLAGSVSSAVGYLLYNARYHDDLSLAQTGMQHLKKARAILGTWSQKPLDAQLPGQAKYEFVAAAKTFHTLNNDLQALQGFAGQVPVYDAHPSAALHLVPLAITLSQAGIAGSDMLKTLATGLHDPLSSKGGGITQSDLAVVARDVEELSSALALAARQVNQLQPSDMQFDHRITKLVGTFHKDLPVIQGWLKSAERLLPVAPALLGVGSPANYLVEVLDSTELRPGGGFIGNYGIASLRGGRLASAYITDVDLLDRPFEAAGHVIPFPPAYSWFNLVRSWSLRDSNLDADFPTAARYAERNYAEEGGHVPVQGVIAITPALIEQTLAITGPIAVPEYHETITAQNLIARIHYHQLGPAGEGSDKIPSPDGHSSLRKRFTALLAEHLLARIRKLPSSDLSKLVQLMANALRSKDLQLYLNSDTAESVLHRSQLDAAIQSPAGDSLFVVDANVSANKANSFITNTLDDQVTIDSEGNAIHHASIRYVWSTPGPVYGRSQYRDFIHVYVPPGSISLSQNGWQPRGTSNAFHREVWMGYFTLNYGQSGTITLVWKVPGAARKDQSGWHYQYTIQRQAGILRELNVEITLPANANVTHKWGGLIPNNKQGERLAQTLDKDLDVGVAYAYH